MASKEDTIQKLSNLSWQRKLNHRDAGVRNAKNEQFSKHIPKSNSESSLKNGIRSEIHQTKVFKAKNNLGASKENQDHSRSVNNEVTPTVNEAPKRHEYQAKNKINTSNNRKDGKENAPNQSRNYNQTGSYHRNYQNDAKNWDSRQNAAPKHTRKYSIDILDENFSSYDPSTNSSSKISTTKDNLAPGIHYQVTFRPTNRRSFNSVSHHQSKPVTNEKFLPCNELFPQLDLAAENSTVEIYSNECADFGADVFAEEKTNVSNTDENYSLGFSPLNQFPNTMNETNSSQFYKNDIFNSVSDVSASNENYMSNCMPSNQLTMNSNFSKTNPYSDQMVATNGMLTDDQYIFYNEFVKQSDMVLSNFQQTTQVMSNFIPEKNHVENSSYGLPSATVSAERSFSLGNNRKYSFPESNNQAVMTNWLPENNSYSLSTTPRRNTSSEKVAFASKPNAAMKNSNASTFNFNGRMVRLSSKDNINSIENIAAYDDTRNPYYQSDTIEDQFNCRTEANSALNTNYVENLNFNKQQISNILQIASLNLNPEPCNVLSSPQHTDVFEMANLNVGGDMRPNVPILSQTVVNTSSNRAVCTVMQKSRVNVIKDCFKKKNADLADDMKCNDSEEMNSKLENVAQQLFNVNKYVTNAQINGETVLAKDSSPGKMEQFNVTMYEQRKTSWQKYRQPNNVSFDSGINSLLSSSSTDSYIDDFLTSTNETSKPFESFPTQTYVNRNCASEEQLFNVGMYYDTQNTNNNSLPSEFAIDENSIETSNFRDNFERKNNTNSESQYRSKNTHFARNLYHSPRTPYKNERNNKRFYQGNVANNRMNSMTNHTAVSKDDSFVNFNRKAHEDNSKYFKFNPIIAKPPSAGILKKPTKSILDTCIQFQKHSKDNNSDPRGVDEVDVLPKKVSFSPQVQQELV